MAWSTTTRYESTVADGGLALVEDLMNTIPAGRPRHTDLLQDLATAQEWADTALADWAGATGQPAPAVLLDERGLAELQALRADLRGVVAGSGDPSSPELRAASIGVSLGADGTAELHPRGQGWRLLVGRILIEVVEAQRADTWRRLKVCRNDRCAVAFYDRSRNNSGTWHNVKICGNAVNLRASRARRRAAAAAPDS
ncbi:CGNR zinc finger domain-containing protein [Actinomycetospora sp. TBRC 11914]|uniref:CGNR zinc finger domain-containing protein n=1 Tax=Actinomycetospora sp. TBRC 11914 TaxID=2729387 RepID=UPI00145E0E64|nr:CGNR zinc finger domain-containing protein [Actinomycetospora sp. TBRC 11914]NMO93878.1 CGNR zinc finger domain-containing protein [Actinomycetospora sp. TBRC 11914]